MSYTNKLGVSNYGSGARRSLQTPAPQERFESYGVAALVALICLGLAAAAVAVLDHGRLGAHSLLEALELGLMGFLTLLWSVGSIGRWRDLRKQRGADQGPTSPAREVALFLPALLPTTLLVVAYLVLIWLTFAQPGFDPNTTVVALAMVAIVGIGRLAWRWLDGPGRRARE